MPNAPGRDETYQLDEDRNRLSSHLSQTHVTDAANRLLSDDDYTYIYDLNGNLTGKRARRAGLPDWDYAYDDLDLLISVSKDGVRVEAYSYDPFGRRTRIVTQSRDIGIINDGFDRALDIANENGVQSLATRYIHSGVMDDPLEKQDFDASGTLFGRYFYHPDHLGSVRYLTDMGRNVVNSYDYDSYGRILTSAETVPQPFAYTGREYSAQSELYYYRARYYDPSTGRFNQQDPIGFLAGDHNLYRYVGSNPLNYFDPEGLSAIGYAKTAARGTAKATAIGGGFGGFISFTLCGVGVAIDLAVNDRALSSIDYENCKAETISGAKVGAAFGGVGAVSAKAFAGFVRYGTANSSPIFLKLFGGKGRTFNAGLGSGAIRQRFRIGLGKDSGGTSFRAAGRWIEALQKIIGNRLPGDAKHWVFIRGLGQWKKR